MRTLDTFFVKYDFLLPWYPVWLAPIWLSKSYHIKQHIRAFKTTMHCGSWAGRKQKPSKSRIAATSEIINCNECNSFDIASFTLNYCVD